MVQVMFRFIKSVVTFVEVGLPVSRAMPYEAQMGLWLAVSLVIKPEEGSNKVYLLKYCT